MTFFKKINRGLILTVVVLLITATYLVTNAIAQSAAKPEIKIICANYIKTAISYKMLPQNYRKENPQMPKAELDKYIEYMSKDLNEFYTSYEQTNKFTVNEYKASLENQAQGKGIIYNYTKEISSYKDFAFKDDTVNVTIITNSSFDGAVDISGNNGPKSMPSTSDRQNISSQTTDTITLQKVNGTWKVLHADLVLPDKGDSQNGIEPNVKTY